MSSKTIYFTDYSIVQDRERFDLDAEISPDTFERLVGAYHFQQEVICQVRVPSGVCHQKHKKGCLGVMKDGHEALIGSTCANKYFKSDLKFVQEKKRIDAEIERQRIVGKYHTLMQDQDGLVSRLKSLHWEALQLNAIMSDWYKKFQPGPLRFIYNAQKTANWNVQIEVETISTETYIEDGQEKTREISRWEPELLGHLSSISEQGTSQRIVDEMKRIQTAFDFILTCDPKTVSFLKLKRAVTTLDEIDTISTKLQSLRADCERFRRRENVQLLYFIQSSNDNVIKLLQQVLSIRGNNSSESDARREEKRIIAAYSTVINGRRFRFV